MPLRLLAACIVLLAFCAPARAQHVICCMLLVDVKGNWVGASRDCAGGLATAPADILKKACESLAACEAAFDACPAVCDQAAIDALRGRMRGLNEAIKAHQKGRRDSELKRAEARDRIWGKGEGLRFEAGSLAKFGKAGLDSVLIATGGGGRAGAAYSKAMKSYKETKEWIDRGVKVGTDPASVEGWADLGQEFLNMQADDVLRTRGTRAARASREHYQSTGNAPGAQRVWRDTMKGYGRLDNFKGAADKAVEKVGKLTGAIDTLAKLYETGSTFANDGQSWGDAYRDQKRAEKDIEKAEAEREGLQRQLSRLLEACGIKPREGLPSSGPGSRTSAASAAAPVFLEGPPGAAAAPPAPAALTAATPEAMGEATWQAMQAALKEVRALLQLMRAMDRRLGEQLVTPLGPWFAGVHREMPPPVLHALVMESRASIDGFEATLNSLSDATERAWRAAQAIPPDEGR